MAVKKKAPEKHLLFLENRTVLVVDPNHTYRNALRKTIQQLGSKAGMVDTREDFKGAQGFIRKHPPDIIFIEVDLDRHTGFEVLEVFNQSRKDRLDNAIFMVSSTESQAVVSLFHEKEIDGYLVKPFTADAIIRTVKEVATLKATPSSYMVFTERGRQYLRDDRLNEALESLLLACQGPFEGDSGGTAHAYLAQLFLKKNDLVQAQKAYETGLKIDPTHYLCLVGLIGILAQQKNYTTAFQYLSLLLEKYPINPKRIPEWVRICVYSAEYSHMIRFAQSLDSMTGKIDSELSKYVAAGLVIACRSYIRDDRVSDAIPLMKKAVTYALTFPVILREALVLLKIANQYVDFENAMKKLPADFRESLDFLLVDIEFAFRIKDYQFAYHKAKEALHFGLREPRVYEVLIRSGRAIGIQEATIQEFVESALSANPGMADEFSAMIEG